MCADTKTEVVEIKSASSVETKKIVQKSTIQEQKNRQNKNRIAN